MFRSELSQFMLVMGSIIVQYIHIRGGQYDVGKYPLSFPIYRKMCEIMYYLSNPENVFDRAFLTMEWSLMDRLNNSVPSYVKLLDWRDDFLIIYFSQSKTNQEGVDQSTPWYVHSAPNNPVIYPVNSLAMYIILDLQHLMGVVSWFT